MQQRIRSARVVQRRSTAHAKLQMLVESERRDVLLIDIHGQAVDETALRVLDKHSPNALSVPLGVNKQGINVATLDAHEAERPIVIINRDIDNRVRQIVVPDELTEILEVVRADKSMRGVNRTLPDIE